MLVGIDVVQRQAGGRKGGELGFDLGRELGAHAWQKEHGSAGARHVGAEQAAAIHQIGHGGGRQHRPAFHQHQVQADAQGRHGAGALHGIGCGIARDHQTGGREDAVAMGARDTLVHFDGSAEVVGRDNQLLHVSSRNAKARIARAMTQVRCRDRTRKRSCPRDGAGTGRTPRPRAGGAPACRGW